MRHLPERGIAWETGSPSAEGKAGDSPHGVCLVRFAQPVHDRHRHHRFWWGERGNGDAAHREIRPACAGE